MDVISRQHGQPIDMFPAHPGAHRLPKIGRKGRRSAEPFSGSRASSRYQFLGILSIFGKIFGTDRSETSRYATKAVPQPIAPVNMRLPAQTESRFSQAVRKSLNPKWR